jgi:hypothetical protein
MGLVERVGVEEKKALAATQAYTSISFRTPPPPSPVDLSDLQLATEPVDALQAKKKGMETAFEALDIRHKQVQSQSSKLQARKDTAKAQVVYRLVCAVTSMCVMRVDMCVR